MLCRNCKQKMKQTTNGTFDAFSFMTVNPLKMFVLFGFSPSIKYKKGFCPTMKSYKNTLKYGDFKHLWRYNLCRLGFHSPYNDYIYPSCWVCGRNCFLKEYNHR